MSGSVVCGVDGSPESCAAARVAAQLSGQLGLRLLLAHVWQPAVFFAAMPGSEPPATAPTAEELRAGEALLEDVAVAEGLAAAERYVLYGLPAERLAELAEAERAELLVVGNRGRGAIKTAFLGSVSHDLIGLAHCPVVVVPRDVGTAAPGAPVTSPGPEDR